MKYGGIAEKYSFFPANWYIQKLKGNESSRSVNLRSTIKQVFTMLKSQDFLLNIQICFN